MKIIHYYNNFLTILTYCTIICQTISAQTLNVNYRGAPQILVAGQYNGLSLFNGDLSEQEIYNVMTASFITQPPNGAFQLSGSTSYNGTINALCVMPRSQNNLYDIDVYIGGKFTTLANKTLNNIARYDPASRTFNALMEGLDNTVYSLYCDTNNSLVYIGGEFVAPINPAVYGINISDFGGGVAIWHVGNSSWSALPFKGFNGPVFTVAFNAQNGTFYFGGQFDATSDGNFGTIPNNSQPINLQNATFSDGNSATLTNFTDSSALICSAEPDGPGHTWLLENNVVGLLRIKFDYELTPTAIGLKNTNYQGRGTKSFRLISLPDNSIITLSYTNTTNGTTLTCSDSCPLGPSNTDYQIFNFVNPGPLRGIQILLLDFYGEGGGLHGIQFYQSEIVVRGINGYNSPTCPNSSSSSSYPNVTAIGNWTPELLPGIWVNVLTATIPAAEITNSTTKLIMKPYIPQAGYYNITLSSPPCLSIGCDSVIPIDVNFTSSPGVSTVVTIAQNSTDTNSNTFYTIYSGYVLGTSTTFQPTVEITPSKSAVAPSDGSDAIIYVDYIQCTKTDNRTSLSGLFQYSPSTSTAQAAWYGFNGGLLIPKSIINDVIVVSSTTIIIGGSFNNNSFSNIAFYDGIKFTPLKDGGLNGHVNTMVLIDRDLFVGGLFNNTANGTLPGLNNIARYNLDEQNWYRISGGVNGEVHRIAFVNNGTPQIHVAGKFNTLINPQLSTQNTIIGNASFGYGMWDNNIGNWVNTGYIDGTIGDIVAYNIPSSQTGPLTFWGGIMSSTQSFMSSSGGLLTQSGYNSLPLFPQVTNGNIPDFIINSAVRSNDTKSNKTFTAIGGKFQIDNIVNVAILDNNVWRGISPSNFQGEVKVLVLRNNILCAGSELNGIDGSAFAVYNLNSDITYAQTLTANDKIVRVNAIKYRAGTDDYIVAGKFDKAGQSSCSYICSWNSISSQWKGLNSSLSGEIVSMDFVGLSQSQNFLVVAGNLTLGGKGPVYVAEYDFSRNIWKEQGTQGSGDKHLPGPPTTVINNFLSNNQEYFVSGTVDNTGEAYIRKWDGSKYLNVNPQLLQGSVIKQMSLVPASSSHSNNGIVDTQWLLLISGSLKLNNYGDVSAALFDGNTIYPFLLASSHERPGFILSVFTNIIPELLAVHGFLPVPIVILISAAIAFFIVFLIVAAGLAYDFRRQRKARGSLKASPRDSGKAALREGELFATINSIIAQQSDPRQSVTSSNVRNSAMLSDEKSADFMGGAGVAAIAASESEPKSEKQEISAADRARAARAFLANHPDARQYYARYPFVAKEEGELDFHVGDSIYVVDTADEVWWIGWKDDGTGNFIQGLFPSNYVVEDPSYTGAS
ncbi:cortical protein marker for cell polarity-domain-containing protein [Gigaspora margarita]|uniref:Cortical protein marker for cell polarity-domain-containing protein n=1 Tax=Gigaspora margarita TaxID=4874 RepID=A0A8H3XEG9_GIGMA|nr:cortical protein marker for cell polarity-domain-containing protein [Gigaspora margarita]